jgi:hypothetical protein
MHDAGEANCGPEDEKPRRASGAERPALSRQVPILIFLPDAVLRIGNVNFVVQPIVVPAVGSEGREDRPGEDRSEEVVDRFVVREVPMRRLVQQRLAERVLTRTDNDDGKHFYLPACVWHGSGNKDRCCNNPVLNR